MLASSQNSLQVQVCLTKLTQSAVIRHFVGHRRPGLHFCHDDGTDIGNHLDQKRVIVKEPQKVVQ